ncbi:hypothetical protein SHIRM173S_00594 [Streptomyces hirsutus]
MIPRICQLVYLGSGDVVTYNSVRADLERVERKLLALWEAIRQATETGDWRPRPHQAVRLVRPPGALSGVRRHSPALSAAGTDRRGRRGVMRPGLRRDTGRRAQ